MGLLDSFTNMSPDQTQGLLSAASQILQASGDPRRPFGFGQAAGLGLEAYQQHNELAKRRKQQEEEAAQLAEMRQMQIGGLRQEQEAAQAKMQRMAGVEALTRDYFSGGGRQDPALAAIAKMQGPTMANAEALEQVQAQAPQQGQQPDRYQQMLGLADHLRKGGFSHEADAAMKQALEFQPKVKNWQEVRQGDRVLYAPFFEDGTAGQPVPLEVARKMEIRDAGGSIIGMDPYTGKVGATVGKTLSPDSIASNAMTMRGQNMTDARARELNATTRQLGMQEKQLRIGELEAKAEERKLTKQNGFASIRANIGVIDKALSHPGRATSTGLSGTLDPRNYLPGTDASDFRAVSDQISGGAFLQAFESLKGAGQITEVEGTKATNAIARLSRAQSDTEYVTALSELREVMNAGLERAGQVPVPKAGPNPGATAGAAPSQAAINHLKFNPRLRAEFDAKYGEGAAAKVLGK